LFTIDSTSGPATGEQASFTVVLIPTVMWTRFTPTAEDYSRRQATFAATRQMAGLCPSSALLMIKQVQSQG
jgi:hypothetical protein